MAVTANILQRTFRLRCGDSEGTCFTLDVDNKRYLVTARHVVSGIGRESTVEIAQNGAWLPLDVEIVGNGDNGVDVSVLAPQLIFGAAHPLEATSVNLTLAEDVYFLGFPFGMSHDVGDLNAGFPIPLVKKGIVSALEFGDGLILLDGHNNPGFSGGPVIRMGASNEPVVIGLVSAYRSERQPILDSTGQPVPFSYDTNTGIVFVCDARHIHQLVSRNPIGIDAS